MSDLPLGRHVLLVCGIVACSTAALFIKGCGSDPLLIAGWRLCIATLVLGPVFLHVRRRHPEIGLAQLLRMATPAAVLLAVHFWSWNVAVHKTIIANATLIVNLVAPVMPIIVWLFLRERATGREWCGTMLAFAGTCLLAVGDFHVDPAYLWGDAICFASMLTFALYLVWSRRNRALPSIWLYLPLVYGMAGVICLIAGSITAGTPLMANGHDWLMVLCLGLIPTVIGHSILNDAMQKLPSQVVAVWNLGQFIPAGILAWLLFSEQPTWLFIPATVLVLAGAWLAISRRTPVSSAK